MEQQNQNLEQIIKPKQEVNSLFGLNKNQCALFGVIHCMDPSKIDMSIVLDKIEKNIKIAQDQGLNGVFLINHQFKADKLIEIYKLVKQKIGSDYFIGLNLLKVQYPIQFCQEHNILEDLQGIWNDSGYVVEESHVLYKDFIQRANIVRKDLQSFKGLYLGGIAFKYQKEVKNYEKVAQESKFYIPIPTTSGTATGREPDIEKIQRISNTVGNQNCLAVASGITPENIINYLQYINIVLVATGISDSFYTFDPQKVQQLVQITRYFEKCQEQGQTPNKQIIKQKKSEYQKPSNSLFKLINTDSNQNDSIKEEEQ